MSFQNSHPAASANARQTTTASTFEAMSSSSENGDRDEGQQRREPEHGPVAPLPHAPRGDEHDRDEARGRRGATPSPGRRPRGAKRRGSRARARPRRRWRPAAPAAARRARAGSASRGRPRCARAPRAQPRRSGVGAGAAGAVGAGGRRAPRLAPTPGHGRHRPAGERGAQCARHRLGVAGLRDRPHHDDARRAPAATAAAFAASIPPIANHGRPSRGRPRGGRGRGRSPAGPPSSGSRAPGRRAM